MRPVFGMAGLAEAAWIQALGLLCFGLLFVTVVTLFALARRSRIASALAFVVALLLTVLFLPWQAFRPVEGDDPDLHSLMGTFRSLAVWWIAVIAGTITSLLWTFCCRPESESKPEQAIGSAPDQGGG